ncbi:MAG TPA: amino acid ABC transporter ATP-binding protein [Bacillota bacterium]|nr:amino acid ABC transporter ATP-binding protein [Bacillota bacterium]HOK69673.1 amino acid ABC transporter ATP-binding protein [Bacillota bacterium]HPP86027.1 amino acid ABC transporter ATP-binding protein [Bacillota bacterium]
MAVFEVKDLRKSFAGKEVLKGISFSVEEGEVVAVIGPSGGGKTTLLRCINQLERIDGGNISVNGMDMIAAVEDGKAVYADKETLRKITLSIGLVFQNYNLFPHFTVRRNITEALVRVLKMPKDAANARAHELLKKMGLADKAEAYPCELSGGQQQRVAIARAMALEPKILFFDEPTSALDPQLTAEILKVIRQLAAEKRTLVIVTHEIGFAAAVADRVIMLDEGVIIANGTPDEVIHNPTNPRVKEFLSKLDE